MARLRHVELRHLRYFVSVAEALNVSRAAQRLRVSQPALSRQIRDLEGELGCRLLERGNSGVALTKEGREFLRGARQVLASSDALLAKMQGAASAERPPLRLTHFGTLVAQLMSPFLRKFIKRHPQVRLQIEEEMPPQALKDLRARRIDAAMMGEPSPSSLRGLESRVVWMARQEVLLPANHAHAKRRKLRLEELRAEKWAMWSEKDFPGFGRCFIESCQRAGFKPRVAAEIDSLSSVLIHVAEGDYISHTPPLARHYPHPGVVFMPLDPPSAMDMPSLLVWRPDSPHAAEICWLAETMASDLAWPPD